LLLGRGGPRDLAQLSRALKEGEKLIAGFAKDPLNAPPAPINRASTPCRWRRTLSWRAWCRRDKPSALVAEPPLLARDGGFVAPGWTPALDEARGLQR
jgi:DNA mismatch repair protein MutS